MRRWVIAVGIMCFVGGVGVGGMLYWTSWRLTWDFGPIVYRGDDGLCSVQPVGQDPPFCPHVFLSSPSFSPDARLIAAERIIGGKDIPGPATEIVVANRRGAVVQRLRGSEGFMRPVWSSDGRHVFALSYALARAVARWSWPDGEKTVVQIHNLDADYVTVQRVSFSPSGRRAALLGYRFERVYLADVQPEGLRINHPLSLPFLYVSLPTWLDEGRLLAIARTERGIPASLWEINADTGTVRKIETPGLALRDWLALSPDRTSVVVTATQTGAPLAWSLWRVDLNGADVMRLTKGREDTSPSWGG
jgi:hypothetical protein